jgi:hypothetical protein
MGYETQESIDTGYEPALSRLTDPQRVLSPSFINGVASEGISCAAPVI